MTRNRIALPPVQTTNEDTMRLPGRLRLRAGTELRGGMYRTSAEAVRQRVCRRGGSRRASGDADLRIDARDVGLDRAHAEHQLGGDVVVRASLRQHSKHVS